MRIARFVPQYRSVNLSCFSGSNYRLYSRSLTYFTSFSKSGFDSWIVQDTSGRTSSKDIHHHSRSGSKSWCNGGNL